MAARPRPPRKRTNDPEATRRRVLDVAAAAFQTRGYHATSTHDIMREAGVTGGALHHHFPTKKAIGLAVIRERVANSVDERWIAPVVAAHSTAEGVAAVFAGLVGSLDSRGRVIGCPLNNLVPELSLADPDFRTAMDEIFRRWQAALTEKLRADQAAGYGPQGDAHELAAFVVAAYSGAMAMAKASQSTAALQACARQLAEFLRPRGR